MNSLQPRLVALVATIMVFSAILLSWLALRHFERELPPEMARNVVTVSHSAVQVLEKAYASGVPFQKMVGVDEFLDAVRKDNPGIAYMLISDGQGKVRYQSGYAGLTQKQDLRDALATQVGETVTTKTGAYFNTSVPIVFHHQRVATLHLGQQAVIVEQQLREISWDVITVLVVASLVTLELMRFVLTFVIATPVDVTRAFLLRVRNGDFASYLPFDHLVGIGQLSARFNQIVAHINQRYHALHAFALARGVAAEEKIRQDLAEIRFHASGEHKTLYASALDHIRWPFFLLIFADSLSLSFFPVFAGSFHTSGMGISKSLVVGLPISIFMFTWALAMPWAGMWSDRVGHRKAFVVGAAITTAGLMLTACAQSLYDLLLWRSLTALGYGLVFITVQGYVASNTPPEQRTKGMAVFLSGFFAGSLSGSAIGGILADRLGYNLTIFLSGFLSASAALFVIRFLQSNPAAETAPKKKLGLNDFKLLLKNPKFAAITFLAAVPAKMALTGFLYYSAPLYLTFMGNNQSTTGRVMMAYGMAIIFLSPFVAKIADRIGRLRWFVSIGGYAAACAMFIIVFFDSTAGLLASITLLGVAHAIGVSPQLALINDFCKEVVQEVGNGTATGIFRLIERLGNVLGPIIAGTLISQFGFHGAFLGIGVISLTCTTSFTLIFFWFDRTKLRAPVVAH